MFDNTKPNVILISDKTSIPYMERILGPYKAAYSLREAGFEVSVIYNAHTFSIDEMKHTLQHLVSDKTLFVGINNFFYSDVSNPLFYLKTSSEHSYPDSGTLLPHGKQYNDDIVKLIKSKSPNCKLVLGGPSATDMAQNKVFNYVVMGYAETSIVNLAQHLLDKSVKLNKSYKSIYGPVIINDLKADDYDFSRCVMRFSDNDAILPGETLVTEIARGCIFRCSFCSYPLNGKKKMDYMRDINLLRDELIDNYERFGVTRYILSDDTVNDSPEKCQMLQELAESLPFQLEWHGFLRLDLITAHPETMEQLYRSGLRSAFFGIETFDNLAAKSIQKGGNKTKQIETVREMKRRYGNTISIHGNFICGLPHESVQSITDTMDFLLSEENPLDSWFYGALSIKSKSYSNNSYFSDLDINYEKYGYTIIEDDQDITSSARNVFKENFINWKNEHLDLNKAIELVDNFYMKRKQIKKFPVMGRTAFDIASMSGDLTSMQKDISELDFEELSVMKLAHARKYKKLFWETNNVPHYEDTLPEETSFTAWLKKQNGIT
jgi:hypothetical protein